MPMVLDHHLLVEVEITEAFQDLGEWRIYLRLFLEEEEGEAELHILEAVRLEEEAVRLEEEVVHLEEEAVRLEEEAGERRRVRMLRQH